MRRLRPEEYVELVKNDSNYWRRKVEGFWENYKFDLGNTRYDLAAFHLRQLIEALA